MTKPRPSPFRWRWRRPLGMTLHTALFAWLVTIGTLIVFALAMVPGQKRTLQDQLLAKAYTVAASVREVSAASSAAGDYSRVIDHARDLVKGDPGIEFIIVVRNDGFALIHERNSWRTAILGRDWRPERHTVSGAIETVPFLGREAFHFAQPFEYFDIDWEWIHVGLRLDTYHRKVRLTYWRTGLLALACGAVAFAAAIGYAKRLVAPVLALQEVVRKVAHGDLSARAVEDRNDELGQLAASVNTMTEALLRRDRKLSEARETLERRVLDRTRELQEQVNARERAHQELAEAQRNLVQLSRDAGRAEIATGVLHSVGNVLNSVNVSATLLQEQLARSQLANLRRAVELLRAHEHDLATYLTSDPQGQHLPAFLVEVAAALAAEHEGWAGELAALAKNVGHIKEIVATQQSYATVAGVTERLSPADLVEDAVRINQAAYDAQGVRIETRYTPTSEVFVDKHKALQILVNLLTNAHWAVEHLPRERRHVTISVAPEGGSVRISVADNGVGIPAENLPRIFRHGFTTRRNGHGFGLHMAALAAQELGGSLTVSSPGPGRGTTFTLELPAARASSAS